MAKNNMRRGGSVAAAMAAAAVLAASAAWACTPAGHQGSIWWCNTTGTCNIADADVSYTAGTTVFYGSASGLEFQNREYTIRAMPIDSMAVVYGTHACNVATILGNETTGPANGEPANGWSGEQMTAPTVTTLGGQWYELCAMPSSADGILKQGAIHTSIIVT